MTAVPDHVRKVVVPAGEAASDARTVRGAYRVVVGDRGRVVVPAEVRGRTGISEGTVLVLLDTGEGLVLLTREQLHERVRGDLAGTDLVAALLAERRAAAGDEDRRS